MSDTDWDIAEGLDPDGPSAADLDRFGDEMTTCPHCARRIYDQTELCPHCGMALGAQGRSLPIWVVAVVALLIVMMLFWVL